MRVSLHLRPYIIGIWDVRNDRKSPLKVQSRAQSSNIEQTVCSHKSLKMSQLCSVMRGDPPCLFFVPARCVFVRQTCRLSDKNPCRNLV